MNRTAFACATLVALLHMWEYQSVFNIKKNLPLDHQKAVGLQTENGFYYSFYDDLVHEPNLWQGFQNLYQDKRSEHPNVINALSRFNIWQEVFSGLLYRFVGWTFSTPWTFFFLCLFFVNGIGQGALIYTAINEGGSLACGIAAYLLLFLNRTEVSRIWNVNSNDLREFWGLPILWIQMGYALHAIKYGPNKGFLISSFLFLLMWQFGSYILILQASAIFLVYLMGYHAGGKDRFKKIIDYYIGGTLLTIAFLFGNWLLVTNIFLSMLISIRVILTLPLGNRPAGQIWRCLIQGGCSVVLFCIIRILIKPYANADTHIFEIICARVDFLTQHTSWCPKSASFNARLYLVMGVFNLIEPVTIRSFMETSVLYSCLGTLILICLSVLVYMLKSTFGSPSRPNGKASTNDREKTGKKQEKKKKQPAKEGSSNTSKDNKEKDTSEECRALGSWGTENDDEFTDKEEDERTRHGHWIFLVFQFLFLLAMGCFINRLRAVFGPPMCVLGGLVFAPNILSRFRIPSLVAITLTWAYIAYLATLMPCVGDPQKGLCKIATTWVMNDADIVEFADWINRNLKETDAIATSMNLSGILRVATKSRTIIHPHFEDLELRKRVQDLYENLYHCLPPESARRKLQKLSANFLVIEFNRCLLSPYKLDPPLQSCTQEDSPERIHDLFCRNIFLDQRYFKMRFVNGAYALMEVLPEPDHTKKRFRDFGSRELWTTVVDSCEETDECAGRLSETAFALHKRMGHPEAARTLMKIIDERFHDSVSYYYRGRFRDYAQERKDGVRALYKKAWDLDPENTCLAREYLLYVDLVENDAEEAKKVSQKIITMPRKEESNEYWEALLESVVPLRGRKDKIAEKLWEEIKINAPKIKTIGEYWNFFHREPYNATYHGSSWAIMKNLLWDQNIRCSIQSLQGTGIRINYQNKWKFKHSD